MAAAREDREQGREDTDAAAVVQAAVRRRLAAGRRLQHAHARSERDAFQRQRLPCPPQTRARSSASSLALRPRARALTASARALASARACRQIEEDCIRRVYETVASGSLDALRSALAEAEGLGLYYSEAADQARAAISVLTRDFTTVRGATLALERALEHALLRPSSRSCLSRRPCGPCGGREGPRCRCSRRAACGVRSEHGTTCAGPCMARSELKGSRSAACEVSRPQHTARAWMTWTRTRRRGRILILTTKLWGLGIVFPI